MTDINNIDFSQEIDMSNVRPVGKPLNGQLKNIPLDWDIQIYEEDFYEEIDQL